MVHAFRAGSSPESILRSFPMAGSLEKVYGAITFYLANQTAVEAYLRDQDELSRRLGDTQSALPAALAEKLTLAKQEATPR
ncbi:MAG: hypothetical protein ABI824_15045 [Acidobacteriota bacterium]